MLVVTLMLADVDGKTYEYGMLRVFGFMQRHLALLISLNSTVFSVPGLCLGLLLAALINVALREVIFLQASNWLDYDLTKTALILGILCGFFIPLLANYLPVSVALS